AQRLIPRLGGGDTAHDFLAVAHVEVEMCKELVFWQWVGGIDTEVGIDPRRADTWPTAHLDAPSHAQPIGQARLDGGGQIQIPLYLKLLPERVTQCGACHFTSACTRFGIVGAGKAPASAALGQVIPTKEPGALERRIQGRLPDWRQPTEPAPPCTHGVQRLSEAASHRQWVRQSDTPQPWDRRERGLARACRLPSSRPWHHGRGPH